MMEFLRRMFGGGGSTRPKVDDRYMALYVQPKRCPEVVMVRIDRYNDLSEQDEGGYFVRKLARGERCPFGAEVLVTFGKNRQPVEVTVIDGQEVDEAAYVAWRQGNGG
jgi:hypothetical protein